MKLRLGQTVFYDFVGFLPESGDSGWGDEQRSRDGIFGFFRLKICFLVILQ